MGTRLKHWMPLLLLIFAAIKVGDSLSRPMWFDEALTVLNFVMTPHLADVYRNYSIPNNHILFSLLLRLEAELFWLTGLGVIDLAWRLVSTVAALTALMVMYHAWKKRCGRGPIFWVLLAFIMTPAFVLYATAIRGYMLGFLLVLLSFEFGRRFMGGRKIYLLWYALSALAAVATIPTNLLAVGAGLLLLLPRTMCCRSWLRWALAAAIPPAMFLLFYLPLWLQLMHNIALKEGWSNGGRGALMVYAGFLLPLLPLILLLPVGLFGGGAAQWRRLRTWGVLLVILGPVLAIPILHPYPFPRTFFVWWPLWLYLGALGIRRTGAWLRRRQVGGATLVWWLAVLALAFLTLALWGTPHNGLQKVRTAIAGNELDDYFRPYYMVDYHPEETARLALRSASGWTYVSFAADPYPLVYYGLLQNMASDRWHFDGPRGRVISLDGCGVVILSRDEKPSATVEKFGLKNLTLLKDNGYHRLYLPVRK